MRCTIPPLPSPSTEPTSGIDSIRGDLARETLEEEGVNRVFASLVEEASRFFATLPEATEVLSEVHQRDARSSSYWIWEGRTGDLSKFEIQGSWHQSDGIAAIGPPLSREEIEIYLMRLGAIVPEGAKTISVPSTTPELESEVFRLQIDREDSRFQMGVRPWEGEVGPVVLEERLLLDGEEGSVSVKKHFFYSGASIESETPTYSFPRAAIEFIFDLGGDLIAYSLIQIHPPVLSPEEWRPFPSARPPFGWTILDYRFLPETEYRFGDYR